MLGGGQSQGPGHPALWHRSCASCSWIWKCAWKWYCSRVNTTIDMMENWKCPTDSLQTDIQASHLQARQHVINDASWFRYCRSFCLSSGSAPVVLSLGRAFNCISLPQHYNEEETQGSVFRRRPHKDTTVNTSSSGEGPAFGQAPEFCATPLAPWSQCWEWSKHLVILWPGSLGYRVGWDEKQQIFICVAVKIMANHKKHKLSSNVFLHTVSKLILKVWFTKYYIT